VGGDRGFILPFGRRLGGSGAPRGHRAGRFSERLAHAPPLLRLAQGVGSMLQMWIRPLTWRRRRPASSSTRRRFEAPGGSVAKGSPVRHAALGHGEPIQDRAAGRTGARKTLSRMAGDCETTGLGTALRASFSTSRMNHRSERGG
jgi:hypothetical protein